jgi:dTDP-4-dehydrorhamnose reductase
MKKILLFGKGGQVGWELQRSLGTMGQVIALDFDSFQNPENQSGDFTDLEGLAKTIRHVQPNVIVNAAAHTAVDKAESEPGLAQIINADAPKVLATEANKLGAWLVHYSTDYVFDGSGSSPWTEHSNTAPLSVYGHTKLVGEQGAATCDKHLIFRTSWVYASRGGNFAKTMLRLASERDTLSVINDQIGAPTSAELLADVTAHALRMSFDRPQLTGLYHCVAKGETSWHGYARFVLEQAETLGWQLKVKPDQVASTTTADYPTPARRPLNSRLDTSRIQAAFDISLPHWKHGVTRMLTEISGKN